MRTQLEVFQRLDSRFRGNEKQGGNDEGDAFPRSPYPKLGLLTYVSPFNCLRFVQHEYGIGTIG